MVEFGSKKYREEIISLWNSAFGDNRKYIENYLDNMCKENIVLITEGNSVIAMASILPVSVGKIRGRYVYAVATDEKYRGRGYGKAIMLEAEKAVKEKGERFLVLVPASESLFEFYKKLGYSQTIYTPKLSDKIELGEKISRAEYFAIREKVLKDFDFIKWSEESLEYILSFGEAREIDGGAVYIENGNIVEGLSVEILKNKAKLPFALIKYIDCEEFKRPYFGLAMN